MKEDSDICDTTSQYAASVKVTGNPTGEQWTMN